MKEWYYYIRDRERRPITTVCLLRDGEGNVARGLAVCSKMDNPCKKHGRDIAAERAIHAMITRSDGYDINWNHKIPVKSFPWFFPMHKAFFNPDLTGAERELINDQGQPTVERQ